MRKFSYAIGIFCTVFLLSLGFYASYQYGCSKDREYSDPALEAENPLSTSYYIQLEDGKVIVRLEDGTVYETTEISKETLPVSGYRRKFLKAMCLLPSRNCTAFLRIFPANCFYSTHRRKIMNTLLREQLKEKQRIVIKIGSSSLTHPSTGALDLIKLEILVREISDLRNQGKRSDPGFIWRDHGRKQNHGI